MQAIVQIKFGSHLYGTNTPTSDLDIKGIYLPESRDILLQRIRPTISYCRAKAYGEKNLAEDIDFEFYSPRKFLDLVSEGQTVALDMLFAPDASLIMAPHAAWHDIKNVAYKLLNKKAASFVKYCKQQANKYGIKGARVAAARFALKYLINREKELGGHVKLHVLKDQLHGIGGKMQFLSTGEFTAPNGQIVPYFEICGKKALMNATIKSARTIAEGIMNEYGDRAKAAEGNQGIDWKALSHAVRVGRQALEFLATGQFTFPRPEAQHLIEIKLGRIPFYNVSEEIEGLLEQVEKAEQLSTLPDSFDPMIIDDFIAKFHQNIIKMEK